LENSQLSKTAGLPEKAAGVSAVKGSRDILSYEKAVAVSQLFETTMIFSAV